MREIPNNEPVVIQDIVVDPLFPRDRALLMHNPSSFMEDMSYPVYPFLRNPSSSFSTGYDHPLYKQVPSFEGSTMTGVPTPGLPLLQEGNDLCMPMTGQSNQLPYSPLPYLSLDRQNSLPFDMMLDFQRKRSSSIQASSAVPKFVRQNTDMQFPSHLNQFNQSNQYLELDAIPARVNGHSDEREKTTHGNGATNHMELEEEPISLITSPFPKHHSTSESAPEERKGRGEEEGGEGGEGGKGGSSGGHLFLTASVNGVDYQSEV